MMRTMTVEDNIPFRETFKNNLLSEFPSMEVIEAANGEEAFKGLASYPIDLVFMDIRLPGESGLDLTSKIKANYKDVTITMLTSKFFNPAFHHLFYPMGILIKILVPPFFEQPLLIMGQNPQRASSGEGHPQRGKVRYA